MFNKLEDMNLMELLELLDRYYTMQEELNARIKLLESTLYYKGGNVMRKKRHG